MKVNKEKLNIAIARSCLTITDLAKKAKMSKTTVSAVISGENCKPVAIGKIAKALGVDVTEIIEQ